MTKTLYDEQTGTAINLTTTKRVTYGLQMSTENTETPYIVQIMIDTDQWTLQRTFETVDVATQVAKTTTLAIANYITGNETTPLLLHSLIATIIDSITNPKMNTTNTDTTNTTTTDTTTTTTTGTTTEETTLEKTA